MKLSLYRYQVNFGATSLLKLHICSYCAHDLRGERRGLSLTIASPMEADSLRIKFQDYIEQRFVTLILIYTEYFSWNVYLVVVVAIR